MEERYIKINKCSDCPFCGCISDARQNKRTHLCSYPLNGEIEQLPAERVGNNYHPITSVGKDISIPWWCRLPKDVMARWICD